MWYIVFYCYICSPPAVITWNCVSHVSPRNTTRMEGLVMWASDLCSDSWLQVRYPKGKVQAVNTSPSFMQQIGARCWLGQAEWQCGAFLGTVVSVRRVANTVPVPHVGTVVFFFGMLVSRQYLLQFLQCYLWHFCSWAYPITPEGPWASYLHSLPARWPE